MQLDNVWSKFIVLQQSAVHELDANVGLIMAAFHSATKTDDFIPLLTDAKSIVLLSKPTFGDKVQLSFAHYLHGSILLNT